MLRSLPFLLLLVACGGSDPVPDADEAAPGPAIEASVDRAENKAIEAQLNATGQPATPEAREQVAENLLGSTDENEQGPLVTR